MENRIIKPSFEYEDERGMLKEVIKGKIWKTINHHNRKKGYSAGGHYHKENEEFFYVVSGLVEIELRKIGSQHTEKFIMHPNEGIIIPEWHIHILHFLEDTQLIALLSEIYDGLNSDTYTE